MQTPKNPANGETCPWGGSIVSPPDTTRITPCGVSMDHSGLMIIRRPTLR